MHGSAAIGLTHTAAATTSNAVTQAIDVSGIANLTVRASASTSAVVRETRSPIPARSTVDSGSDSTRRMKSSRSSANIRSERTNDDRRAKNVSTVCRSRKTDSSEHGPVDLLRVDPGLEALHERAEDRRPDQPRAGGESMQEDDADDRPPVPPGEGERLPPHLRRVRDRQQHGHAASPRVTTSWYSELVRSRSRCRPAACTRPSAT